MAVKRAKTVRELRRRGLREIRLVVPDARLPSVRRRVAAQVPRLNQQDERDVMEWIEAVSEFDIATPK